MQQNCLTLTISCDYHDIKPLLTLYFDAAQQILLTITL